MKRLFASTLALAMLTSGAAFAAPPSDQHDSRPPQQQQHEQQQQDRHDTQAPRRHKKGEHLAKGKRGQRIDNYSHYGLNKPPKGHQWRKVDNDYVLIAIATGVIANVITADR